MVLKSLRSESAAKSLAQRESHDRHIALRASQKAQQVTFEQLQQTRASVDAWLIDLSGSLQFFPGLQPIRDHLLEQAKQYYSHSIDLSINNATIDLEHAKASIDLVTSRDCRRMHAPLAIIIAKRSKRCIQRPLLIPKIAMNSPFNNSTPR